MEPGTNKLFWKLGAFGKFDFKRFASDVEKLKVRPVSSVAKLGGSVTENVQIGKTENSGGGEGTNGKKKKKLKKKVKLTAARKAELRQEEINRIRNKYHIHVSGTDIPPPLASFEELQSQYNLSEAVLRNIRAQDYVEPTGVQRQVVPIMLEGRDVMACAPTGSGKTVAFILPILHHLSQDKGHNSSDQGKQSGPRALVLAPTRELAKQSQREFRKLSKGLGLKTSFIEKMDTLASKCSQDFDILVTTPNRLVHMLEQQLLTLTSLRWLVVDESDKLFEAGQRGFRDQLGAIYRACANPNLQRAMLSATFAQEVEEWCKLNLDNVVQVTIGARNTANNMVQQELVFTGDEAGKLIAIRNLVREGLQPPVLVFVQSKERAKHLYTELMYDDLHLDVIHADRPQDQRDEVVRKFRLGQVWMLICTELLGRGIDFKGVNLVVNYDFPTSGVSYIHRIGRTGRAGRQGRAVTYFTDTDKPLLRAVASMIQQAGCPVPEYMLAMKKASRRQRHRLAQQVPTRKPILTMDPQDYKRLKLKRKLQHQKGNHVRRKKPKTESA